MPKRTRIAPPRDVVKLSERFFFLLQPDLESILESSRLEFPREPFPFQLDGMAFLVPRHGAVLADEMGLGKSMQAISSLRLLIRSGEARRVLVVCPKGLVSNWTRELADWAPELLVAVIEGDPQRRRWQWSLQDVPVKVANYEAVVRDRELVAELGLEFDLVVLDEAQRIKNRSSSTSEAIRSLHRKRSWALTGTPVENTAEDLVSIFEFVAPGHLNDRMSPRALGAAAADHVLRRTKDKVLKDMPPRMNRDERIELTAEQRETYRRAEEEGVLRLSQLGQEATIQNVFELVLRLKQICNFDTATGESAKLDCLEAELEEIQASGKKSLVFSQWVETIRGWRGSGRSNTTAACRRWPATRRSESSSKTSSTTYCCSPTEPAPWGSTCSSRNTSSSSTVGGTRRSRTRPSTAPTASALSAPSRSPGTSLPTRSRNGSTRCSARNGTSPS